MKINKNSQCLTEILWQGFEIVQCFVYSNILREMCNNIDVLVDGDKVNT